jgi:hypothetical protein
LALNGKDLPRTLESNTPSIILPQPMPRRSMQQSPVLLKKIDSKAEAVKDLAYCLYDISANKRKDAKEATAYNALIADWTELTRQAAAIHDMSGDRQIRLNI